MLLLYHRSYVFTVNDKGYLLYHNVALYILVQSEEEHSLIWKAKSIQKTIQTDKVKC